MIPLRAWVDGVERGDVSSLTVTLLVHGTPVEGALVPSREYEDWVRQALIRAIDSGGRSPMPDALRLPPDELESLRKGRTIDDLLSGESPEPGGVPEVCYLRDAVVRSGPPMYWKRFPYLVVTVRAVSAYALGLVADPELFGDAEPEQ